MFCGPHAQEAWHELALDLARIEQRSDQMVIGRLARRPCIKCYNNMCGRMYKCIYVYLFEYIYM